MTNLATQSNAELVGIYNGLCPDKPLSSWKGRKDVLIGRIHALAEKSSASPESDTAPKATEKVSADETVQNKTGKQDARTIRAAATELLCKTEYHEDRNVKSGPENVVDAGHKGAHSVGIPYDEIIDRIRVEFPDCQTTVACLRWYSVKIRVEEHGYEGLRLPQRRPRAKSRAA